MSEREGEATRERDDMTLLWNYDFIFYDIWDLVAHNKRN